MPRRRNRRSNLSVVMPIAVGIIAGAVGINVFLMSQAPSPEAYVTDLQEISDQSRVITQSYEDAIVEWEKGLIEDSEMMRITGRNLEQLESLLSRLKTLEPSERYEEGHKMSILSLEYELQSNEHMRRYIETGDQAEYEKSSELFQIAFDYEAKAFQAFADANKNT